MIEKNYAGLDGFIWWMGVVESRNDPLEMGRCKVRVHGWHSPSLGDIPSDDLPWAVPVNSLNSSSFATAKEGDFVFGFFADGRNAQVPLILGIVPAFAIEKGSADIGFNDLRDEAALAAAPKKVTARSYSRSGGGSKVTEESPETYPNTQPQHHHTIQSTHTIKQWKLSRDTHWNLTIHLALKELSWRTERVRCSRFNQTEPKLKKSSKTITP
jgi:hypothetical protein